LAASPVRRPAPSQVSSPTRDLPCRVCLDRHLVCTVSTRSLAGAGVAGVSDGVAGGALFNAPTAAAYAPPGSLYAAGQQLANGGGTAGTTERARERGGKATRERSNHASRSARR